MLLVADVAKQHQREMTAEEHTLFGILKVNVPRSSILAVTHVDHSARIQTLHRETNPRYHALLSAFKAATGCPVLVNTSFNVRGELIVCTPEDAFRCFMRTEIEVLVIGELLPQEGRPGSAASAGLQERVHLGLSCRPRNGSASTSHYLLSCSPQADRL